MAVIITNMNIPKSCAQCNKIGLGFSVNCRKNIYGRSAEGQDARHKDCPLKSTDEIIKEFGNASSNYPEDDDYSQGIHYGLHVAEQIIEHILYGEKNEDGKIH